VGFGNCANFVSSNIFLKTESPRYPLGFTVGLVFTSLGAALIVLATVLFRWKNQQKESRQARMSDAQRAEDDEVTLRYDL